MHEHFTSTSLHSIYFCSLGTFKSTVSNEQRCEQCPLNSHTKEKGSTSCICNQSFFRLNSSVINSSCIAGPNEPENVTIDDIDQVSVYISWKQSTDNVYHIECTHTISCESYIIYQPNRTFINGSRVKIIGLDAETKYKIRIYAEQVFTHLYSQSVDLTFTTKSAVPKQVRNIQIRRTAFDQVVITWSADDFNQYHIRYWPLIAEQNKIFAEVVVNNFTLKTTSDIYKFQIRAHTKLGWTAYSEEMIISLRSIFIDQPFSSEVTRKLVENKNILLISPLIILGLIITVIILAVLYIKKKRVCRSKTASDCESLDYQKRQVSGHYGPDTFFNSGWSAPLWPSISTTTKTYVDPHTYEDPTKAVNDFAHELDPNSIVIESVIGGGIYQLELHSII
ncbi:unnamed protein product [Adineta ricciae]|uniref:Fibronectin type-III domain-containing protein n=2 Tax=Adineta ricciae TaxID=249248 RepID=A0A813ZXI4_ADIRI|nr:unnamed protein product [Adineta ricciae]